MNNVPSRPDRSESKADFKKGFTIASGAIVAFIVVPFIGLILLFAACSAALSSVGTSPTP